MPKKSVLNRVKEKAVYWKYHRKSVNKIKKNKACKAITDLHPSEIRKLVIVSY